MSDAAPPAGGTAPLRVGLTGASGLVGAALRRHLEARGFEVFALVRRTPRPGAREIPWSPDDGRLNPAALAPLDAVVHLAGEPVAGGRWTPARKRLIRESRVQGTRTLAGALAALAAQGGQDLTAARKRTFVQASAIGYYGAPSPDDPLADAPVTEASPPGEGFLAEVCQAWEEAGAGATGYRHAVARLGIVLSPEGGALAQMLPPFRLGLGGPIGGGRQFQSWIHLDDAVEALRFLIEQPLTGPFNLTAPEPVPQAEFARALGKAVRRPAVLPAPALPLRLALGEMADEMLLRGARVLPTRLLAAGFRFSHPHLPGALAALLG